MNFQRFWRFDEVVMSGDWLAEGVKATLVGLDKAPDLNGELVSIVDPVPRPKDGKIRVLIIALDKDAHVPRAENKEYEYR